MKKAYKFLALAHIVAGAACIGTSIVPTFVPSYFILGMIFSLCGLMCWKIMRQIEQQEGGK